jgi:hypothetical protein
VSEFDGEPECSLQVQMPHQQRPAEAARRLGSPCGEEEEVGSSSDSGQGVGEQAASNWAQSVVSLTSSDEGDYFYTHQLTLHVFF